jgi:hypothetical protein
VCVRARVLKKKGPNKARTQKLGTWVGLQTQVACLGLVLFF